MSSFLEPLSIEYLSNFDFSDFKRLLQVNLSAKDLISFKVLLRSFDLVNFSVYWSGREIVRSLGEVTQENVASLIEREQWADESEMEIFLKDYLLTYKTDEERVSNFSSLVRNFLIFHREHTDSRFIFEYFSFKQDFRVITAGFRAKMLNKDVSEVLRDEDSTDFVVLQTLMQKNSLKFIPPRGYGDLEDLFEDYGRLPEALHHELTLYEYNKVEELFKDSYFDLDVVLGRATTYMMAFCYYFTDRKQSEEFLHNMERI